jgi:hypothetical protein
VAARSATDVWAVGATSQSDDSQPLAVHWNGRSWTRFPTPALKIGGYFNAVAGSSASSVWAVGRAGPGPGLGDITAQLIEHWDGRRWTVQHFPSLPGGGQFSGVAALSAGNAWAVGYAVQPDLHARTLTAFWNGCHWRLVASPSRGDNAYLFAVTASWTNNIWAVGTAYAVPDCIGDGCGPALTLIMHWNGTRWKVVPSPNPLDPITTISFELYGVAAVARDNIWAAGSSSSGFILHWNGKAWS